ncbi:MAG: hypothetical protein V4620_00090 [Bacteroidota bacterium]
MKTKYTFIFIMIALLLQSCGKEKGAGCTGTPGTEYFTLKTDAINKTPYFTNPTFDTVSFASDKGDTLIFVKTKTDTLWYEEQGGGSPDCGYNTNSYQVLHNTYTTIKGDASFDVKHSKKNDRNNINIFEIQIGNYKFYESDGAINNFNHPRYIGSLTLNNKTFNNVLYSYNLYNDSTSALCYLNKDNGLFYFYDKLNDKKFLIIK